MPGLRLIIAVDGTTNTAGGSLNALAGTINGIVTSVKRIHDMVQQGTVPGTNYEQCSHYFQGVGTTGVNQDWDEGRAHLIVRSRAMFEAATGAGYVDILRSAYKVCCQNVASPHDEIWMFGFSRGAFIIRALASMLQHVGLIKPEEMITERAFRRRFSDQLQRYSLLTTVGGIVNLRREFLLPFAVESPRVRFLGAFDTVKAVFPMPLTNTLAHGIPFLDFDQDAPRLVQHFRHALALNEARPPFAPSIWSSPAIASVHPTSYLEAWFFGHHNDVGGGSPERGLALWPLQWMLSCAVSLGLRLDTASSDALFPDAAYTLALPHQPKLSMHDILPRHAASPYRLVLHAASPRLQIEPRNYHATLTGPGARVFVHPSTYLLFNTSAAFRVQLYTWRRLHRFLQDRAAAVPPGAPWWERQAEADMLNEVVPVRRLRVLVYGREGAGKAGLVGAAFGVVPDVCCGIETPVERDGVSVHCSDGFGAGRTDTEDRVRAFVEEYERKEDVEERLHAVWYCVDLMSGPVADSEHQFAALHFGGVPVVVVLTNADARRAKIAAELSAAGHAATPAAIEDRLEEVVAAKKSELSELRSSSFVPVDNTPDSITNLLSVMFERLSDPRVQAAEIRAQRASPRLKLASATDAAARAYAVWRAHTFTGASYVFRRNPGQGLLLSQELMAPVLDVFNVRDTGAAETIRARIGAPWRDALDDFPTTLWHRDIPPHAVLCCMLDTTLVAARAMARRSSVESACAWYKLTQGAVHTRLAGLLAEDGSPREGSVAWLQIELAETLEWALASGDGVAGVLVDALVGVGRSAYSGVTGVVLGSVTVGFGVVFGVGNELRRSVLG